MAAQRICRVSKKYSKLDVEVRNWVGEVERADSGVKNISNHLKRYVGVSKR